MSTRARVWKSMVAVAMVVGCLASAAEATIIADWQFNTADTLFVDSSGNGNALTDYNAPTGWNADNGGCAVLGLNAGLATVARLNLTPYTHIVVSWSQRTPVDATQIIFEHSSNSEIGYYSNPGAFIVNTTSGNGLAAALAVPDSATMDTYSGMATDNTWQNFAVEYNLSAANSGVVKLFKDGVEIGTDSMLNGAPSTFANDWFCLGSRNATGAYYFTGQLGYVRIESIPEPGVSVLLASALTGLLCYAWWKR